MSKKVKFDCECGTKHILYVDESGKIKHETEESENKKNKKEDYETITKNNKKVSSASAGKTFKDFLMGSGDFAVEIEEENIDVDIEDKD